jgi:hypothetical protein
MRVTCAITSGATVASAWCAVARNALLCILQEVIFRDLQREMKKLSSWRGVRLRVRVCARVCACVSMCVRLRARARACVRACVRSAVWCVL